MDKIQTVTIAWLAGLLDGEGSFSNGSSNRGSARIDINMTDRDVIERVAAIFKGKVYTCRKNVLGHKTAYSAVAHGPLAAGLMMTIYPFMGERRRKRIREVLHQWRTYQPKKPAYNPRRPTACSRGHEFTDENTYTYIGPNGRVWRNCRTCKADHWRMVNAKAKAARHARGLKKVGRWPAPTT